MKLKKSILLSSILLMMSCTDHDNKVSLEMTSCEGTECSFDASKSKVKSHSHILEYDWEFHDGTEQVVTDKPTVTHDFDLHVGATLNGDNPDLDLRDVTLDEVLTGHRVITKEFIFRTHQHDPQPSFTAEETPLLLGSSDGSATMFNLDASASEPGQGTIKGYVWEIDGQKIKTELPELQHTFSEKSSGDVKLTVINSFGVETSIVENVHILQNEPRVTNLDIFRASKTDELYDFRADFDDFDSERYSLIWELNQVDLGMPDTKEIKNIRVNEGSNEISAILKNKSNGREVSHVTRIFDTGDISFVEITSLDASFVKYSDGLHYDFNADIKNFDSAGDELIYELNGDRIFSNRNIKVNEGENIIVAKVIDKQTKEVLTEKNESFVAKKLPLNISHVIANQSSDRRHYNFYDLTYSFDDETQYKEWELNGNIIHSTDDVLVANGKNKITLYIKDKLTNEILDKKSKYWDVSSTVEIKQVNAEEIANSDGLHYALSAEFDEHFNPNEQYVAWTVNGKFIDDPSNVLVENGLNKFVVYIYDKASGDLIAAANTKVNVSIHQPKIKTVEINVDDDLKKEGLEYSFDAVIDNYDDVRYKKEWLLNGKKLDSTKQVDVLTDYNTLELYLINNYTNETADYYKTDFVARGGNATIKSLTPDRLDGKNGLHYRVFLETDKYDSSVYNIDWSLNGKALSPSDLNDFVVNPGKNEIKATISYKSTGEVSDQRTVEFNAEINKPSVDIVLAEPSDDNSLEYRFKSSIDYNFRDQKDFDIVWLVDGVESDIPSKDDTLYTFDSSQTGEHSVVFALRDIATGEMYSSSPTTIFVKQNKPAPEITSLKANKYLNRDGLDYRFIIDYKNPDMVNYGTRVSLNDRPLVQIDDVRVERGENVFTAEITDKNKRVIHTYDLKFDAELNDINIKTLSAIPRSMDGLEYNFKADLELNNRDEKDFSISWYLDGSKLSEASGADVSYSFNAENLGKHTIEAKVKDSVTGKNYEKDPVEINVQKITVPAFTSEISADIVAGSDGLHYDFAIDTNDYDKTKYDLVFELNGTKLDTIKNVLVKEGENTVVAKLVAKDGTIIKTSELKTFDAKEIRPVPKILSAEASKDDVMTFNFKGEIDYNGRNPEEDYVIYWYIDDQGPYAYGVDMLHKFDVAQIGTHKIQFNIKKRYDKNYEAAVKYINVEGPKLTDNIWYEAVPNSDGLHYNFNAYTNAFDKNDYGVVWTLNGETISSNGDASVKNIPVRIGKNEVRVEIVANNGTVVDTRDTSFDASIASNRTPAYLVGQAISSVHKGNSGASFPYITIDLADSVKGKGVKFVTGTRLWNGKSGSYDYPYEQGDSFLHFNTGSATQDGYYDFTIELAKGNIHQKGTYTCKQKTTLWVFVWEPDLYDCTDVKWQSAYIV